MPSKNSINKPKDHMIRSRKATSQRAKNSKRASKHVTTVRSSNGLKTSVTVKKVNGTLVNTVVSNKKAKKLERNRKYQMVRDGKAVKPEEATTEVEKVREALWRVIEMGAAPTALAGGEGTTLGGL